MTTFLRLLIDKNKQAALLAAVQKRGENGFEVDPASFCQIPGAPFAYWVSEAVRKVFQQFPGFENDGRTARQGLATADDYRFVRIWWETANSNWFGFAKGGAFSPVYADVYLVINWGVDGHEMKAWASSLYDNSHWSRILKNVDCFFRPGLTWPRRTNGLSFRIMPAGCIFADKGPATFVADDDLVETLALSCLLNSSAFGLLVSVQLARTELAQSFEVGLIQQTPVPPLTPSRRQQLAALGRRAWSLKRSLDTVTETSHAFMLPAALRARLGDHDPSAIESELVRIQLEIDGVAFDLYGFAEADRQTVNGLVGDFEIANADEDNDDGTEVEVPPVDALLSWAVGVAFGRFDWRLATGEREVPGEPDPFDPLPAKSPGMLPDGAEPFHAHAGILVDDQGHPDDLAHIVEEVLDRVDMLVPDDVRRWLQRDFFAFHLQRYSKSRRKAPIYWPLATASGNYTLWLYYPSLSSQTLYTAINDFVEPKLKQVGNDVAALRNKGAARSRDDEKQFETLQGFDLELIELRDTMLNIAQGYQPNHDDGVQITAAPLWPLFRHKLWQKILKDTWAKLEKGDYDWAHLAMSYWPGRVREKCKTDKSLAIAHDLEALYVEPEAKPKKNRAAKGAGK